PSPPSPAAPRCFHCGERNPEPTPWHAELSGETRYFCCAGCLGIARTIHGAGLDAFYERRTEAADRPLPGRDGDDEWSHWDAVAAQEGLVRAAEGGKRELSLLLEGIHCGACVWLIESWLARQPGVALASVNFATRRARLVWDPAQCRLSDLLRTIAAIGYRAFPYDPARREALAQRESRSLLLRLAVAVLAMMQVMMFAVPTYVTVDGIEPAHRQLLEWASLTLTLPALVYSAAPFFAGAWRDLRLRRPGMDVPIALGLGAAFAGSAWATFTGTGAVYYDSVTMFIALLLCARYVELVARRRAGDAVERVARARPATAERLMAWPDNNAVESVGAASLAVGEHVLVRPGGTVPADGDVVEGQGSVEEAILTGEAQPRAKAPGNTVLAGSVVRDGALVVRVSAAGETTRLAAIERLAERAASERPRVARVADRIAGWFVGTLLVLAALTAVIWWQLDSSRVLAVTFAVLVVSCPCALSLATPAALAAAAGALSRRQVVIVRGDALETLSRVTHVVFDKTGTLTTGRVALLDVLLPGSATRGEALALAAALESRSEHPVARAFRDAVANRSSLPAVADIAIHPGNGVEGTIAGRRVRIGRPAFAGALSGRPLPEGVEAVGPGRTRVALGDADGFIALFGLGDALRPGAAALVARLKSAGIKPVLLSGDGASTVAAAAQSLGIAEARGDAQPDAKREAIARMQVAGAVVAMVGDGINDAPSLAQAQVSVSLGSATPLAQWTADVVVLSDELPRIADAIVHARRTFRVVRQNLAWAFAYNVIAIPAAAFGHVTPLVAALGMSISSLFVVGNAMRVARLREAGERS
ncbi:MAG: heavy metal translocating P-type ATPase, partial [Betaproteobacteria bacterium]|nr:heavy metal translocating P-type ATPase [Betaproteobacteria bacterium]